MGHTDTVHIPVLLQEVLEELDLQGGECVCDGTLGGGGYTRAIAQKVGSGGRIIALDQDTDALARFDAKECDALVETHHAAFGDIREIVAEKTLDAAVLDIGISSDQLVDEDRGISFAHAEAPLDMRMNRSSDNYLTAWGILQEWSEEELANALYRYGDERRSRAIARAIKEAVQSNRMDTVADLLGAVESVVPRSGRIHPATRTFQALRIVTNDELGQLEKFLDAVPGLMRSGGRVCIVSFHSAEDRLVKHQYLEWKRAGLGVVGTKKPITPSREEIAENPRSRSAKLRTFIFN